MKSRYDILLRTGSHFSCEATGETVHKDAFHLVAVVTADSIDQAYALTQNGNPDLDTETKTWARDRRVALTIEGIRLRCIKMNGSLRSTSVGDIIVGLDGAAWMVDSCGWLRLEETEDRMNYRVCHE